MKSQQQVTSLLSRPLSVELCQQIYFHAAMTSQGQDGSASPDVMQLRALARSHGPTVFIRHPDDINEIFHGVTLAVYQDIRSLFCSPLYRVHSTVWRVLDARARRCGKPVPSREAVWATCAYMRDERDRRFAPLIEQLGESWFVGLAEPDTIVRSSDGVATKVKLIYIVKDQPEHVLAFELYDDSNPPNHVLARALYNALVDCRRSHAVAATGLKWQFPQRIMTSVPLSSNILTCCDELGMQVKKTNERPTIIADLQGSWTHSLAGRTISPDRFELILDNYLEKRHGYGPRITREDTNFAFRHRHGYNKDPALVLPPLRHLLPTSGARVAVDGTISIDGQAYYDPLLTYYPGQDIKVRRALHDSSCAYVYLDGDILCQAHEGSQDTLEALAPYHTPD